MRRLRAWFLRLGGLLDRERCERELAEELESHLQMHIEDNLRAGMSAEGARRQALIKLGGIEPTKEQCRERHGLPVLETLMQDVRVGVRGLLRARGISMVCVLVLALGIGASTALYSVWRAALVFPYSFESNGRWVAVLAGLNRQETSSWFLSVPEFNDLRQLTDVFESVSALQHMSFNLTDNDRPEEIGATATTANAIADTGVAPQLGRLFLAGEDAPGGPHVVLLSDVLWRRRYFADPNIVGKQIRMNGEDHTVIGVMPPRFRMWGSEMWVPLPLDQTEQNRSNRAYWVTAMLRKGVSQKQADARLAVVAHQWEQLEGNRTPEYASLRLWTEDVMEGVNRSLKNALLVLLAAIALLLVITCANVAGLLLARAHTRRREVAIRLALGGGRLRIVRQFLTESVILAAIGGAGGLLLAWRSVPLIGGMVVDYVSTEAGEFKLDPSAFLFLLILSVAMGLLFGFAPALQAIRISLTRTLKEGGRNVGETRRGQWPRKILVVTEISLALIVLAAAGLMIRSYHGLANSDLGFDHDHVLQVGVPLPANSYRASAQTLSFFHELQRSVSALPGVEVSGLVSTLPLYDRLDQRDFAIEERSGSADARGSAAYRIVTPDYFRVLKIHLDSGRLLSDDDRQGGRLVAVVNETFAKRYWPNQSVLGKRIDLGNRYSERLASGRSPASPERLTIVGVIGDVRQRREWKDEIEPEICVPYAQTAEAVRSMRLVVRSRLVSSQLMESLRSIVHRMDSGLPLSDVGTMNEILRDAYGTERLALLLLTVFAGVSLLLAVAGVYALLAYVVSQQSHEIGIRMALGAEPREVLRHWLAQGARLAVVGVTTGIAGALVLTHAMASLLYKVSATDPWTFAGTAVLLLSLALLACYVPARRATRVDPMVALRYE